MTYCAIIDIIIETCGELNTMINLLQISKEYALSGDNKVEALRDVSLSIPDTGLIAIVGKSGSGKTTLLNIIGGIDIPTSGKIEVDGEELKYTNRRLDLYRNYVVGLVFQDYNLLEDYTVLDNVKLGLEVQGKKNKIADSRAKEELRSVGLEGFEKRKISSLSGGQRQRVAIARALCKDSRYVLCDEPTGNLDSTTSAEIFTLIKTLSKKRTFIVVTHDDDSALKYADRIITIYDGVIVKDKVNITEDIEENKILADDSILSEQHKVKKSKTYGLGAMHCLQMVKHNITHSVFSSTIMFLLLAICFTLVSGFISLSQYSEKDAYLNTLKANNQYILSVSKYIDKVITYAGGKLSYGYRVSTTSVTEDDVATLQADMPEGVSVYASYYFLKPLSDFGDIDLTVYGDTGYSYAFKEAIVVEDFSSFNSPLIYGSYPSEYNDVLIYDYMAYSLIEQGLFNVSVSEMVGQVLTDTVTGIELRISGIIGSNFKDYLNLTSDSYSYDFARAYLSGLNAIFCGQQLIDIISSNTDAFSMIGCSYVSPDGETISASKTAGQYLSSLDGLKICFKSDSFDNEGGGVIISKDTLAAILGISVENITKEIATDFMDNYTIEFKVLIADPEIDPMGAVGVVSEVIAITEESFGNDGILYFYASEGDEFETNENGEFRQIYIGLSSNWNVNKSVINYFWYADAHEASFYEENPDYYDEVFSIYDPAGFLITDVNDYLINVKDFAGKISYILLGLAAIVVLVYTFISLQKYNYKIGVLKAIGAKTSNIILIFGLQLILISLIAFVLSIPLSYLLLSQINGIFIQGINSTLVFFAVKPLALFTSLAVAFFGVMIIAGIPLMKLALASPVKTILASRKR